MNKKLKSIFLFVCTIFSLIFIVGKGEWIVRITKNYSVEKTQAEPVAYINNLSNKYTTIEGALDDAQIGDIVFTIPPTDANYNDNTNNVSSVNKVTYTINRDCEIKEGVSLVIPTDEASISSITNTSTLHTYIESLKKSNRDQGNSGYNTFATSNTNRFLRTTIEIASGITLTNNGDLVISGYLSGGTSGSTPISQTSHSYSRFLLNTNAKIISNNANSNIYCFGYIQESSNNNNSEVSITKGNLYVPFVINDYRGFYYSYAMTAGAIEDYRCSPFNEFEFRNISPKVMLNYNSNVYGLVNVYVNYPTGEVDETSSITLNVLGNTNSFFVQLTNSTYSTLEYKYNESTGKINIDIFGDVTLNSLNLSLTMIVKVLGIPTPQTVNLSTTEAYLPISYKFTINLYKAAEQSSASYNFDNQRLKIMPGAELNIHDGVSVQGNELIVYSYFFDGSNGSGQGTTFTSRKVYGNYDGGKVTVSSSAVLSFNTLAGVIYSDNSSNIVYTNNNATVYEPWTRGDNSESTIPPWAITDYLIIREKLQIVSLNNLNLKKVYIGVNVFTSSNGYYPKINILFDANKMVEINEYQTVLFFDELTKYQIQLINNVFSVYSNSNRYNKNSEVSISSDSTFIGISNSNVSISNNNNGINEFDVQSIVISGNSHTLYTNTVQQMSVTIDNLDKIYNKNYTWSSSDTSVAKVDENGLVTAVGAGLCQIIVTCDGVVGAFDLTVEDPTEVIEPISSITITNDEGKAENAALRDGNHSFTVNINPSDAEWASITWEVVSGAGYYGDRIQFLDSTGNAISSNPVTTNTTSITIKLAGGMSSLEGINADYYTLRCTVVDKLGNSLFVDYKIQNGNQPPCIVEGTLITMADGSQKKVEDLKVGDAVMVFNHATGKFDTSFIAANVHEGEEARTTNVINLVFDNGQATRISFEHGFFDVDKNEYVYINESNYQSMIGHRFYNLDNEAVTLIDAYITEEAVKVYSPVSYKHLNIISDNLISIGGDLRGLFNIFELNDDMTINIEKMNEDIATYGLYTYEDWEDYLTKEEFDAFNAKYLKVSIGKGLTTKEEIIRYIKSYL